MTPNRVGIGYDAHRFASGRPLVLGGITIPHELGLEGHSDADVVLHALTDALLGALALGDIGTHFPPSDERNRNRPSLEFLIAASELVILAGYRVVNIDCTILAEAPKVMPYATQMREAIGRALQIAPAMVSIKATTNEGMGFVGRSEGIAALAVVSVAERNSSPK